MARVLGIHRATVYRLSSWGDRSDRRADRRRADGADLRLAMRHAQESASLLHRIPDDQCLLKLRADSVHGLNAHNDVQVRVVPARQQPAT